MAVSIVLEQLCLLFLFMLAGFALGKSGIIVHEHSRILSTICVYVFSPCMVFNSFCTSFRVSELKQYYQLPVVSLLVLVALVILMEIAFHFSHLDGYEKRIYKYTLAVSNFGYMGYPLMEGLYGAEGLLYGILFSFPLHIYVYTVGFCMLTSRKLNYKLLINPVIISLLLGVIFGLFSIPVPDTLKVFIGKSGDCMAPVAMLLAGMTMSEFKVREMLFDKKIYFISILRLVAIPAAVLLVLKPFASPALVRAAVVQVAMPCGMNTIVFPKLIGEDCSAGAKLAFVSNILCIATIPILLRFL